jgi:hypothetical protein
MLSRIRMASRIPRRVSSALSLSALILALSLAGDASAGPKEDLEKAEQLYANLDYEAANKLAQKVVQEKGLTHDQLVRGYRILGISHAVLDREEKARDAFVMLLTIDPEFQADPNLGPRVTTPFFEARGYWRSQPVRPGIEVLASVRAHEAGSLKVTLRDPTHLVKKAQLGYRFGSEGSYQTRPIQPGEVTVPLPEAPSPTARLEYYVQAFDDKDSMVMENGRPATPKIATVDTPKTKGGGGGGGGASGDTGGGATSKGFFGSTGFWAIAAGVVVVGVGTGIFLATRPKDESPTANVTPGLFCGGAPPTPCN